MKKITALFVLLALTFAVNAQNSKTKVNLVIHKLKLDKTPLSQALQAIQRKSKDVDPEGKGVNLIIQEKDNKILERTITMDLDNIPVKDAVKYVLLGTGLLYSYKDNGNSIYISSKLSDQLVTKFYRVSSTLPSFVSPNNIKQASNEKKLKEFFTSTGIKFPKGARISFNPGTSTLSMSNTLSNQTKLVNTLRNLGCLR